MVTRVILEETSPSAIGDSERENTCNRRVITRFWRGRIHLTLITVNVDGLKEGLRGKTMTNDVAIRDEMKSVERWENEGGRVSPLNNIWASLKGFTTKDNYHKAQIIDAQQSLYGQGSSDGS